MSNSRMSEIEFESLLRHAVIENFYEELDSLPPREELAKMYTASPEHEKRMRKLFARENRKEISKKIQKIGRRAAAAALILVILLFSALMFNPEVRATVVETIKSWSQEFVRFTSPYAESEGTSKEPTFIPAGFWEEHRSELDFITTVFYMNADGEHIMFESTAADGSVAVDGTDVEHDVIIEEGIEFHVFVSTDELADSFIVWEVGGWIYRLYSTIPVEYLQIMALSLG
ncbi:MAG: DUF4367 domain-containing protein [Oscillospiraceae bacterium]|nr:DUF4367 domain-containing protein [Oscillospiraceae bacterium]MCL2279115.1 DUF4367 domain-containing protein [Oscillospiraceae bacterium]